ncbi:lysozyme inhibitor LprI family protein [Sphingomonas arantia]|uniref:Lysozyme inhibitor LprI family protein n=1 Tax=Sphingomonas arantia TaxID=1460676 RepID=A0ABW4TZR1_9SPHN
MISLLISLAAATAGCGDKPNQTAMTMCQQAVAAQADADMDRTWKQVYATMQQADRDRADEAKPTEPGFAAALLASQRAWLAFRDAECRIESYEWRGGTMQPFTAGQCLAAVTRQRTAQLRAMLGWTR